MYFVYDVYGVQCILCAIYIVCDVYWVYGVYGDLQQHHSCLLICGKLPNILTLNIHSPLI